MKKALEALYLSSETGTIQEKWPFLGRAACNCWLCRWDFVARFFHWNCLTLAESPARGPGIVINGLKLSTFKELRESPRVTPVKSVEPLSFEETIHICAHFCTLSANPIFCLLFFALRRLTLDSNFYTWPKNTPERFIKNSWMMLNS